jgi:pyridoxine kinase
MRVLSVQSHVVSGYVGNKVATFALQTHGIEVDVLNTCQLSNHTGYTSGARGPKTTADEFAAILDGLAANGLLPRITHLLTGYAASEQALGGVERAVSMINAARPSSERRLVYVCDPVLGDDGVLYVPASLIPIYRERILPLAEVLTPNAFELSLLAGTTMPTCEAEVFAACEKLHDSAGLPTIIVTGVSFASSPQTVAMFVSQAGGERFALAADRLDSRFTGSGDLTSALILAWRELLAGSVPARHGERDRRPDTHACRRRRRRRLVPTVPVPGVGARAKRRRHCESPYFARSRARCGLPPAREEGVTGPASAWARRGGDQSDLLYFVAGRGQATQVQPTLGKLAAGPVVGGAGTQPRAGC